MVLCALYLLETKKCIFLVSNKYGFGCLMYLRILVKKYLHFLKCLDVYAVVPALVSVFSHLGSYGIRTEIFYMF